MRLHVLDGHVFTYVGFAGTNALVPCLRRRPGWTGLQVKEVITKVRELCERLVVVIGSDGLSVEAQRNATIMFHS